MSLFHYCGTNLCVRRCQIPILDSDRIPRFGVDCTVSRHSEIVTGCLILGLALCYEISRVWGLRGRW